MKAALGVEARAKAQAERDEKQYSGQEDRRPPREAHAEEARRNFTDPDSRIMKGSAEGFVQARNVQAADDAHRHLVVTQTPMNQTPDFNRFKPIPEQLKASSRRQAKEFSADPGDCSEQNPAEVDRSHINAYVATGRRIQGQAHATANRPLKVQSGSEVPEGVLLPIQFYEGARCTRRLCGEQRLMLALLADAISCLLTDSPQHRQLRDETRKWLAGRPSPVPFEDACEAVGLSPCAVRAGISKLIAGQHDSAFRTYLKTRRGHSRRVPVNGLEKSEHK